MFKRPSTSIKITFALLLSLFGFSGNINTSYIKEKNNQTAVRLTTTLRDQWMQKYNEQGTDLAPEIMREYDLYKQWEKSWNLPSKEYESIDKKLHIKAEKAFKRFTKEPTLENYTGDAFYYWFKNTLEHCKYFVPQKVVDIFNLREANPLFQELKTYNPKSDYDLVRKMLTFATLLVHQRMDIKEYKESDNLESMLLHLQKGKGDCSDYTYAIANLYLAACDMMNRPELSSRIRTVMGLDINDKKVGLHNWIQIQEKNSFWKNIEANADELTQLTPFSLLTQPLCTFENGEIHWRVPIMSIKQNHEGKKWIPCIYAHVMPE